MKVTHAQSVASLETREKTLALLKKPETIVGVVVLGALGVLAINTLTGSNSGQVSTTATDSAQVADQSAVEDETSTEPVVVQPTEPAIESIAVLANTSSSNEIVVQSGDTFWSLAETHCGSGAHAVTLERNTGYRYKQLKAGDVIEISCR